ncbi:MAG: isoprenylcysteine carboxylmethyltransferase family protein [bacterium]|nr:isoprenylcysteine carboxylmethyltransferase family protein [bacterium]
MENTFDRIQLIGLAAFVTLFVGRSIYMWRVRGINPIRLSRGKPLAEALIEACLVIVLPIWLYEIFAFAWPLPWHVFPEPLNVLVIDNTPARVVGCVLIASGIALFAAALLSFGDSWRVGIDQETPGGLVTGGVFAFTRNPIFVFMDVYALGSFLVSGRLLFGLFTVLTVVIIHQQIRREEAFLASCHGEAYSGYRDCTPRYLFW